MLQFYKCVVLKVNKKTNSFSASIADLDEQVAFALTDVDPDEMHLVKKGAKFVWFVTRYNQKVISFNFANSSFDKK